MAYLVRKSIWITCWSQIQKNELMGGADWADERVNVGGMPPYDGYIREEWVLPRQEYFKMHGLDPERKLLTYASSFVNLSPNIQNIEALASLVASDRLAYSVPAIGALSPQPHERSLPAKPSKFASLPGKSPLVHIIEPATFGAMGHYSIEDLSDRTSMMAHTDVFMTVYSTMVVEGLLPGMPDRQRVY